MFKSGFQCVYRLKRLPDSCNGDIQFSEKQTTLDIKIPSHCTYFNLTMSRLTLNTLPQLNNTNKHHVSLETHFNCRSYLTVTS